MFKIPMQVLNSNMIFIHPLLMYLLILNMAACYMVNGNVYYIHKILLFVSMFLLSVAFVAGWFHINKLAIENYFPGVKGNEAYDISVNYLKQFFYGVGENFLKVLYAAILYIIIYFVFILLLFNICMGVFGEPVILTELPKLALKASSQNEIFNYLNGISLSDKIIFIKWVMSFIIFGSFLNYLGVVYFTVLTFREKNAFVSLVKSIEFIIKNLAGNLAIIALMFVLYIGLNFLVLILGTGYFWFVVLYVLFALYLNYYVLLVFWYYNEKTKNNSCNGPEFVG